MRSKRPQKKQSVLRRRSARGLGWTRDQGLVGLRVADREAGHEDDLRRVRRGFDLRGCQPPVRGGPAKLRNAPSRSHRSRFG